MMNGYNSENGYGIVSYDEGRYQGELSQDNLPHGFGTFYQANGEVFAGNFLNGLSNGCVKQTLPDGQQALYHHENGNRIREISDKDCWNGKGKIIYNDGRQYDGEIREGVPYGRGKMECLDGTSYDGYFIHGLPHGNHFVIRMADGTVGVGDNCKYGRLNGEVLVKLPDGQKCLHYYENNELVREEYLNIKVKEARRDGYIKGFKKGHKEGFKKSLEKKKVQHENTYKERFESGLKKTDYYEDEDYEEECLSCGGTGLSASDFGQCEVCGGEGKVNDLRVKMNYSEIGWEKI